MKTKPLQDNQKLVVAEFIKDENLVKGKLYRFSVDFVVREDGEVELITPYIFPATVKI